MWKVPERWGSSSSPHLVLFRRADNNEDANSNTNTTSSNNRNMSSNYLDIVSVTANDNDDDNDSLPALEDFASPRSTIDIGVSSNMFLQDDNGKPTSGRASSKTLQEGSPNKRSSRSPNKSRSPNSSKTRNSSKNEPLSSSSHHSLGGNRRRSRSRSTARRQRVRSTSANPSTSRRQDPLALSSSRKTKQSRNSAVVRTRTRSRSAGPRTGSGRRHLHSSTKRDSHRIMSASAREPSTTRKADPLSASCHSLQQKQTRQHARRSESNRMLDKPLSNRRHNTNGNDDQPATTVFTMRRCSSGEYPGPPPASTLKRKDTPTKRPANNHRKKVEERTNMASTRSSKTKKASMRRCLITGSEGFQQRAKAANSSKEPAKPSSKTAAPATARTKMPRRCASEGTKRSKPKGLSKKRSEEAKIMPELEPIMDMSQMTNSEPSEEEFEASLHANALYLMDPTEHDDDHDDDDDDGSDDDDHTDHDSSKHSNTSNNSFRKTLVRSLQLTSLLGGTSDKANNSNNKSSPNLNKHDDVNNADNETAQTTKELMTKGVSESLLGGRKHSSNPNLLMTESNNNIKSDMGSVLRKSLAKSFQQNVLGSGKNKPSHSSSDPNLPGLVGDGDDKPRHSECDATSRSNRKSFVQNLLGGGAKPASSYQPMKRNSDPTIMGTKDLVAQEAGDEEADEDDTIQSVEVAEEEPQDSVTTDRNDPKQAIEDALKLTKTHIPGVLVDVPKKKRQAPRGVAGGEAPLLLTARQPSGRRFPPKAKSEDIEGKEPAVKFKKKLYRRAKSCNMEAIAVDKRKQMSSKTLFAKAPPEGANKPTANSCSVIGFDASSAINTTSSSRGECMPKLLPPTAPTDALRTNNASAATSSGSENGQEPIQTVVIAGIVLTVPPSKESQNSNQASSRWESEPTGAPKSRWDSE